MYTFVRNACVQNNFEGKVSIRTHKQPTPQVTERHGLGWAEQIYRTSTLCIKPVGKQAQSQQIDGGNRYIHCGPSCFCFLLILHIDMNFVSHKVNKIQNGSIEPRHLADVQCTRMFLSYALGSVGCLRGTYNFSDTLKKYRSANKLEILWVKPYCMANHYAGVAARHITEQKPLWCLTIWAYTHGVKQRKLNIKEQRTFSFFKMIVH